MAKEKESILYYNMDCVTTGWQLCNYIHNSEFTPMHYKNATSSCVAHRDVSMVWAEELFISAVYWEVTEVFVGDPVCISVELHYSQTLESYCPSLYWCSAI